MNYPRIYAQLSYVIQFMHCIFAHYNAALNKNVNNFTLNHVNLGLLQLELTMSLHDNVNS